MLLKHQHEPGCDEKHREYLAETDLVEPSINAPADESAKHQGRQSEQEQYNTARSSATTPIRLKVVICAMMMKGW